ncbi:MAG TPA: secondary thiamine-phosphate synthase enzyme YjbQ [Bacteroidales bacterium]|nr:secondary thiamine-phosphate synthase enzyme YjbQ [Bacteroidales bacterium]
MDIITKDLHIKTNGFSDIHNLTEKVNAIVKESDIKEGICNVFVVGSTASISTMEFEPALVQDVKEKLEEFASKTMRSHHSETWGDDNGFSHIRATFMGPGISVPIRNGKCILGTWQQIVVLDHDNRPRDRHIIVQVMGQ